ncbi:MAG: ATP-dependent zinc protease [Bacteroidia bacterium]|nr:ATP-dependent zinc protease [Bacteroidia bacterium]MCZ2247635.1 RimK/LysX family protein [Bacteroidia bacterium]
MDIIGRKEKVSFPELDIYNLEAKIDTGAYTTALHCCDIQIKNISGKDVLCFRVVDSNGKECSNKEHQFDHYISKLFKSSFGEKEHRYVIRTLVVIGKRRLKCKISLTDRKNMRYPVLIGRRLLKNKFIVDVSKNYHLSH